jgi:large conductance mechanosensitive channel
MVKVAQLIGTQFIREKNTFDVAVGFVIATAAQNVIKSFVEDLVSPPIGFVTGRSLEGVLTLRPQSDTRPALEIAYGKFLKSVLQFVLMLVFAVNMGRVMRWIFQVPKVQ